MDFSYSHWEKVVNYFWEKRDKRVDDWFLMDRPIPIIISIFVYILFSLSLGPWIMKNKKPFHLRKMIFIFNVIMVLINSYLHYQFWVLAWGNDYSWRCQPLDRMINPRSIKIAQTSYIYFIVKFVDWLDTLFFVLRKKFTHVSSLHIYHHMFMPSCAWFAARFMPGGHGTFCGFLNSGVHVIMHTYYALAALGPEYQKYLWWKRHLTQIQLLQFLLIFFHGCQPVFLYECGIDLPLEWGYYFGFQAMLFFFLFGRFYQQTYLKRTEAAISDKKREVNGAIKTKMS